jgi:hypothetical protein
VLSMHDMTLRALILRAVGARLQADAELVAPAGRRRSYSQHTAQKSLCLTELHLPFNLRKAVHAAEAKICDDF